VLETTTLIDQDGIVVRDVSCRDEPARGEMLEAVDAYSIVFVRRGVFVRVADGVPSLCDSTIAYCSPPGEDEAFDHPHSDGDDCTLISFDASVAAALTSEHGALPVGPVATSPAIDLQHRRLVSAARRGEEPDALFEAALDAVGRVVQNDSGRRAGRDDRGRVVSAAREALAVDPGLSLPQLGAAVGSSPHHLSRMFRAGTGITVSRYRLRLRARTVLERLAAGELDLARLAAEVGLADQSHLCRVVRSETGATPSSLRALLEPPG